MFRNIFTATLILTASFCGSSVRAQENHPVKRTSLFFRYGVILSAEYTDSKPKINDPTLIMSRSNGSYYVQILFRPDKGRTVSIHDFALANASGTEFPCIAVGEGDDPYSGIVWNFRDVNGKTLYRMLFAVPSADGEFHLVFKLYPTKIEELPFLLKKVNSFTTSGAMVDAGRLLLPAPQPPPKPKEEPKAEEKEPVAAADPAAPAKAKPANKKNK